MFNVICKRETIQVVILKIVKKTWSTTEFCKTSVLEKLLK